MTEMEKAVEELIAEVEPLKQVVPAVIAVLDKYADDNIANADEPEKIRAQATAVKAQAAAIAEAVAKHTKAEEPS